MNKKMIYNRKLQEVFLSDSNKDELYDFRKVLKNYNVDFVSNVDLIKEVEAWRKFYKNKQRKYKKNLDLHDLYNFGRDFNPYFLRGQISDFIFEKIGLVIDLEKTGSFSISGVSANTVLGAAVRYKVNELVRQLNRVNNKVLVANQVTTLYKFLKDSMENPYSKALLQQRFTNIILNIKNEANIANILNVIQNDLPKTFTALFDKENKEKIAKFVFGAFADYDYSFLTGEDRYTEITKRLRENWALFAKRIVFKKSGKITPDDVFSLTLSVLKKIGKQGRINREVFNISATSLITRALNKELKQLDFNSRFREIIRKHVRIAFRNGISEVGLDPADFKILEDFVTRKINNYTRFYVTSFSSKLFSGLIDVGKALTTSEMWSNKVLNNSFEIARLAGDRNGLYEWVYGDTNHCPTCLRANGQRHRLKDWHASGILPQSLGYKELMCGGYNCKCKLVRVTGKARGRLSSIPTH